jgi:hypothetical protein
MSRTTFAMALASAACLFSVATQAAFADNRPSAPLRVDSITAIPGHTLPPGQYRIQVVDHLSDRYVLSVDNPDGTHTLFLAIPEKRQPAAGEVLWHNQASGATYIRGWQFSGMSSFLQFVYPKNDAVAVAKANNTQVPAIDPESDGMKTTASLSKEEAQMITLWLLTPTPVGPNAPAGIEAHKLQQVASLEKPNLPAKLPRTASDLPLFWLCGGLSLLGAGGLRMARLRA